MRPLIGITCCTGSDPADGTAQHVAADSYVRAVGGIVGGVPVLLPASGAAADIGALVARLDGLVVTGSLSNVHPDLYAGPPHRPGTREDRARDAVTLPLIRAAVAAGLPMLAICRGFQELNVAYGGTLHQHVAELPGRLDHSAPRDGDPVRRRARRHLAILAPGGLLHRLAGAGSVAVNSLHDQGIDRLATRLAVEARAPDGVIEAVRVAGSPGLALGLQWHPEIEPEADPFSRAILGRFAAAVRRETLPD